MRMMDEFMNWLAHHFTLVLVIQHLQESPVDKSAVAIGIHPISAFSHRIEHSMQALAGFAYRLLRLLKLSNVFLDRQIMSHSPIGLAHRRYQCGLNVFTAVLAPVYEFAFPHFASRQMRPHVDIACLGCFA